MLLYLIMIAGGACGSRQHGAVCQPQGHPDRGVHRELRQEQEAHTAAGDLSQVEEE